MPAGISLCVLFLLASLTVAVAPPRGTRSLSQIQELNKDRRNSLHKRVSGVYDLKADYFDTYMKPSRFRDGRDRYWLVLFYASWCQTCDEFQEPLTELAKILHTKEENEHLIELKQKTLKRGQLALAKHDVTADESVAMKYGIEGYPTVVLFDRDDEKKRTVFNGDRTTDALVHFINAHTDIKLGIQG